MNNHFQHPKDQVFFERHQTEFFLADTLAVVGYNRNPAYQFVREKSPLTLSLCHDLYYTPVHTTYAVAFIRFSTPSHELLFHTLRSLIESQP